MPHVVVKGNVDGGETKVFGLTQKEFSDTSNILQVYGGRVGQDGHTFLDSPITVLNFLQQQLGYTIISSTGQGPQASPIWTLHRPFFRERIRS